MSEFELSLDQLKTVQDLFRSRILEGLQAEGKEIGALATYLGLPDGRQAGRALVVDTGGTNMRVALVELSSNNGVILSGPITDNVPSGRSGQPLSAEEFFSAQARLSLKLDPKPDSLPLGYCFSYPTQNSPDGDALLLRWTKGLRIDGVVGSPVGSALQKRLSDIGIATGRVVVLNDTVASLLGGVHLNAEPRFGCNYIGLILGTGTNMAGVFSPAQMSKVEFDSPMIANLESGNFSCPFLTAFDDELDAESDHPGSQRFEKAVSGRYLPQLFDKVCPGHDLGDNTAKLVALRDAGEGQAGRVAARLLRRSARLAAAGLGAVASLYSPDHATSVLAEGGLLWGDSQFAPTVRETLKELHPDRTIELVPQRENVNLLGAACAALSTP